MNHRLVYPLIACLSFVVFSATTSTSSPAVPNVEILVGGAPVKRYAHRGRWYIEALKGREYAIRLHNPYPVRVAVALAVDGLNTIDAAETTAGDARKWVMNPYQTITISSWQTSQTHARRFEFTTEERSYGQALGKTANLGIISAVFYKERVQSVTTAKEPLPRSVPAPTASARMGQSAPDSAPGLAESTTNETAEFRSSSEYAATGMGRSTDHAVTSVRLDLEAKPAHTVNIRYEYRAQLVRLGILPRVVAADPLQRRERAEGFESEFCPVPAR